jgi:hypothetical protein
MRDYKINRVFVDGSNRTVRTTLKNTIGESIHDNDEIYESDMIVPVSFGVEHKKMLWYIATIFLVPCIFINYNLYTSSHEEIERPGTETMPEGKEYWIVTTVDDKGNKALTGGIMKTRELQGITNHFDVKSVQEYTAKVEKFGGKVITPKTPVPGVGYLAMCQIHRIIILVFFKRIKLLNE